MGKKSNNGRFARKGKAVGNKKLITVLSCIAVALVILIIVMLCNIPDPVEETPTVPTQTTAAPTQTTAAPTTETTEAPTTVPQETEPVILEEYAELYGENQDLAGWLRIGDTVIDYPVMFTPEDEEKYLYANFQGNFDVNGMLFIGDQCTLDPESDNLIIYGHNMISGAMFGTLARYESKQYWEAHPIIEFSTLYEHRRYEIVAAFYDRVYSKADTCFKFYKFVDVEDEEKYAEGIAYFKEKALYDTGVTVEYGDRLITLVTCAYHVQNGRFVVVAREITEEPAETAGTIAPTE